MRRLLLATMMLAACVGANAGEVRFEQHKALTLKALSERQQVLAREVACVQAAQRPRELAACNQSAKFEREAMGRSLRLEAERHKAEHLERH